MKPADDFIRVWSTGCATGEEAYSVAKLLTEALGEGRFQEQVKIFATDLDEEALTQGKRSKADDFDKIG